MRGWLLVVLAALSCERSGFERSRGPDPAASPLLDADDPDALPDREKEASFILPPEHDGEKEGASFIVPREPEAPTPGDCEVALRNNQYWCAPAREAGRLDAGDHARMGCPDFIRGSGRDGAADGADGLPRCATGSLEPCKTGAVRKVGRGDACCYAWSCPTH